MPTTPLDTFLADFLNRNHCQRWHVVISNGNAGLQKALSILAAQQKCTKAKGSRVNFGLSAPLPRQRVALVARDSKTSCLYVQPRKSVRKQKKSRCFWTKCASATSATNIGSSGLQKVLSLLAAQKVCTKARSSRGVYNIVILCYVSE